MQARQIWLLSLLIVLQVQWITCLTVKGQFKDSIEIKLIAFDLSEDMSILSSNDDEILLLIYELNDQQSLQAPLFAQKFNLDSTHSEVSALWQAPIDRKFLVLMIEQDSESPIEQLDPVLRVHYQTLIDSFQEHDLSAIKKHLGDEDLLGISILDGVDPTMPTLLEFKGIHRADSYRYEMTFH
jgi:hypothetical protein